MTTRCTLLLVRPLPDVVCDDARPLPLPGRPPAARGLPCRLQRARRRLRVHPLPPGAPEPALRRRCGPDPRPGDDRARPGRRRRRAGAQYGAAGPQQHLLSASRDLERFWGLYSDAMRGLRLPVPRSPTSRPWTRARRRPADARRRRCRSPARRRRHALLPLGLHRRGSPQRCCNPAIYEAMRIARDSGLGVLNSGLREGGTRPRRPVPLRPRPRPPTWARRSTTRPPTAAGGLRRSRRRVLPRLPPAFSPADG